MHARSLNCSTRTLSVNMLLLSNQQELACSHSQSPSLPQRFLLYPLHIDVYCAAETCGQFWSGHVEGRPLVGREIEKSDVTEEAEMISSANHAHHLVARTCGQGNERGRVVTPRLRDRPPGCDFGPHKIARTLGVRIVFILVVICWWDVGSRFEHVQIVVESSPLLVASIPPPHVHFGAHHDCCVMRAGARHRSCRLHLCPRTYRVARACVCVSSHGANSLDILQHYRSKLSYTTCRDCKDPDVVEAFVFVS